MAEIFMLLSNTPKNRAGVLVILTDRPHPQGGSLANCEVPVKPSDVAQWIRQAVQLGWQPQLPGITFEVQIAGGRAEKIY
ncbi:hypothetical protein QUA40_18845 [Microcoleus sp. Pol11C3]|uniref:hypothetical protein n=1 Tax=Microcoleus sp. Pol11C3 TaxID=3055390 RepID=UPI002FD60945